MVNLKEQKNNLIFLSLILFMFIYFAISFGQSFAQDKSFIEENQLYLNADNLINQGKYSEAEPLLDKLLDKQMNNYIVLMNYAMVLFDQGDYIGAKDYYERALEQRPFLRRDANFDSQYGQLLYRLKQYEEAKKWLEDAMKLNSRLSEDLQPIVNDIEKKIHQK